MTTEQLRELDAWIAEHVMGCKYENFYWWDATAIITSECPKFSTNPADAFEVLKKCLALGPTVALGDNGGQFFISQINAWRIYLSAETLEIAICLFAKKLYETTYDPANCRSN